MSQTKLTGTRRAFVFLGGFIVAATWFYLVITRPTDWGNLSSSRSALFVMASYVLGSVIAFGAALPVIPARVIAIMPMALALNMVVGQLASSVGIPLYLDSVGTILIAALAGPLAGMVTGTMTNVVWSLFNPTMLPFAAVQGAIGLLAGYFIKKGAFKNVWTAIGAGVGLGVVGGILSSPIAAFVFGGTTGVGTGIVVSIFKERGNSLLGAVTMQSFLSDSVDKALVMVIVYYTLKMLPKRVVASFKPEVAAPHTAQIVINEPKSAGAPKNNGVGELDSSNPASLVATAQRTINPLTILTVGLSLWILVLGINNVWFSLAVILISWIVGTLATKNLSVVITSFLLSIPLTLSLIIIHVRPGETGWSHIFEGEGFHTALLLCVRFVALMSVGVCALAMITIVDLVKAIQSTRMSPKLSYLIGASIQFLPQAKQSVTTVREARVLNGVNPKHKRFSGVVGPVMMHAITQGSQRSIALEVSGIELPGARTVLRPVYDSRRQFWFRVIVPLICLVIVAVKVVMF